MAHKNTQALADILDDLTAEELTNLIFNCWVNNKITRGDINGFRKDIGKPTNQPAFNKIYYFGDESDKY